MKVKDKEKFNNPLKGWQILSAISSMVFHTVHWYDYWMMDVSGTSVALATDIDVVCPLLV